MKETLLQAKEIQKWYPPKKEVLKEISFTLYKGEILALLGVNGAGKTTLSSILATLIRPTKGDILWKEKSIYNSLLSYRKILGYCPQKPNLDATLTLNQNLIYAGHYFGMEKKAIEKRKEELLLRLHLKEQMDRTVKTLSGGFRQLFLLARTLMHNPQILILDEPTVGLDPHMRRTLWDLILLLKKEGKTIILTTHYLEEIEVLSDRVCLLDSGVIKYIDTPQNLKNKLKTDNLEEIFLQLVNQKDIIL